MKVSYLITCCNETYTLQRLLETIGTLIKNSDDEVVVLIDKDCKNNEKTISLLQEFAAKMSCEIVEKKTCKIIEHSLNNDYGSHKNFGVEKCSGDWIMAIDGDELLPNALLDENLHALIESNPNIEAYAIPRINDFRGVTQEHANQWGWKLTNSPTLNRPIVNFPDYQWRLFKNIPTIRFKKRLHEKIEGYLLYSILPEEENYAIYHDKTIETQIATNRRYNKEFTKNENLGNG